MKLFIKTFLLISLFFASMQSCNKSQQTMAPGTEEVLSLIKTYTGGIISKTETLQLELTETLASQLQSTALDADIIDITPKTNGELSWLNDNTLQFIPANHLKPATEYEITWKLSKLKAKPALKDFQYVFHTITQQIDLDIEEIRTQNHTSNEVTVSGTLRLADYETHEDLQRIIKAKQGQAPLNIQLSKETHNSYRFEIPHVQRKKEASKLELQIDAEAIKAGKKAKQEIEIAPKGEFRVMQIETKNQPGQYVKVQFSDALLANQNIKGLVELDAESNINHIIQDNILKIHLTERVRGDFTLKLYSGIKNYQGKKIGKDYTEPITFSSVKPNVRFPKSGSILPTTGQKWLFPFEAVNLAAVDVVVTQIYENNIPQFLQVNELDGNSQLRRVGKIILKETIPLNQENITNYNRWNPFYLDLSKYFQAEPGAIYRVSLGYRKAMSLFSCEGENKNAASLGMDDFQKPDEDSPYWEIFKNGYFPYSYKYVDNFWSNREDPCHEAYYRNMKPESRNILASDLGMMAQQSRSGQNRVIVTDLQTAKPLGGINVKAINFQNQVITQASTNSDGIVNFEDLADEAVLMIAERNNEKAYLKLSSDNMQSMSHLDVGGRQVREGLKGFIYGDRGVWRPGDSIYVSFMLQEKPFNPLPDNHPILFELTNPMGEAADKQIQYKTADNLYVFRTRTQADAPTGYYTAKISVGDVHFTKTLPIETVKPNRLKVEMDFPGEGIIHGAGQSAQLHSAWLHGAKADKLEVTIDATLSRSRTKFEGFNDFLFEDTYLDFSSRTQKIVKARTDGQGDLQFSPDIDPPSNAPGQLNANFVAKVFEPGGNFSIRYQSVPFHPFQDYVGFTPPTPKPNERMLLTDTTYTMDVASVTAKGQSTGNRTVRAGVYKLEWRWWWQGGGHRYNYSSSVFEKKIKEETFRMGNSGRTQWSFKIPKRDWGRYLIRFEDTGSGHVSSKVAYFSYPGWWRDASDNFPGAAAHLTLNAENESYTTGEEATLVFPGAKNGQAFISIETGDEILESYWIETTKGKNRHSFEVTEKMAPNIYAHVTLLQPHAQTVNDLPIRLYGAVPVRVENPATHLQPELSMPDELEAEKNVKIKVSETEGQAMSYTLAIIDEGLLDLTNFNTPDPWADFYAKEALGVKSWDIFYDVIGAYSGSFSRTISIGGGMSTSGKEGANQSRFEPMVRFIGPFDLKKNRSRTHEIDMPRYIGSVRTMLIAKNKQAYGYAEKTTPVKKPLMLLATLPRVLGPGEEVSLPVSIFAEEEATGTIQLSVETNDMLQTEGPTSQTIRMREAGEEMATFRLKVPEKTGTAVVKIKAKSGKFTSETEVNLNVRNPNPYMTNVKSSVVKEGQNWSAALELPGIAGTNTATLEVSAIPPINLEKRLKYLIRYPHGCAEQVTSSGFPQLVLQELTELSEEKQAQADRNIRATIQKLKNYQLADGGFAYWPGLSYVNTWVTNYAGHFLLEAQARGYAVPEAMLDKWANYQKNAARKWLNQGHRARFVQAYRLYTLALADKPVRSAMNRLREDTQLTDAAAWRLAAAYATIGRKSAAEQLIAGLSDDVPQYRELSYTYGSSTRDKAMILETLALLNKESQAFSNLKEIAEELSGSQWMSTQTVAYSLLAVGKFVEAASPGGEINFEVKDNHGKTQKYTTDKPMYSLPIDLKITDINFSNKSDGMLYTRLITSGRPAVSQEEAASNNLRITVKSQAAETGSINLDKIEQGSDFEMIVSVINPTAEELKEVALTQVFPSGWEIFNARLFDQGSIEQDAFTYQDIRDDRVLTYFDLDANRSKTFRVKLNAAYAGKFYLPAFQAEAMYDATINARNKGQWVEVITSETAERNR